MAYWEDAEGGGDWIYALGFYDNRDFWITKDEQLINSPHRWLLVTDPKNE